MQKLLFLLLLLTSVTVSAEPLRVFASVAPLQTMVQRIGGQHVDARVMVRPGFDPHAYDPTPKQISALTGAVLYVRTGLPFEQAWMKRIRSANQQMQVLDVRDGINLLEMTDHSHDEHDATHAEQREHDPHVWTSPQLASRIVGRIRDRLSQLAPAHAATFQRNHDSFVAELDALDRELRTLLDPLRERSFLVFHPAWGYFADSYGLVQVSIEHDGKEPGARALATLIDHARHERVQAVFVQPQADQRQAYQIAGAINAVVITVDPLAANYIDNLRHVGRSFARALQH